MSQNPHQACHEHHWLMQLCRWLPVAVGTGVLAALLLGRPLSTMVVVLLLVLCLVVCLVLYVLSKEAEGQIAAAVAQHKRREAR